jgi:hypothetical protein
LRAHVSFLLHFYEVLLNVLLSIERAQAAVNNTIYAVALSNAALPAAAWPVVRFSLCERKNEQQKEGKVPLRMTTFGHRVSPVNKDGKAIWRLQPPYYQRPKFPLDSFVTSRVYFAQFDCMQYQKQ